MAQQICTQLNTTFERFVDNIENQEDNVQRNLKHNKYNKN